MGQGRMEQALLEIWSHKCDGLSYTLLKASSFLLVTNCTEDASVHKCDGLSYALLKTSSFLLVTNCTEET